MEAAVLRETKKAIKVTSAAKLISQRRISGEKVYTQLDHSLRTIRTEKSKRLVDKESRL